jgi:hypothetical protein
MSASRRNLAILATAVTAASQTCLSLSPASSTFIILADGSPGVGDRQQVGGPIARLPAWPCQTTSSDAGDSVS